VINLWYGGLVTGAETVKKTGAVIGVEAGARVWRQLDVSLEGGSFGNVVPQRQLDRAQPLTEFLQQNNGQAAAASVKMPAVYGGVGARWVFEDRVLVGWARPYVHFGIGGARVKRQPTFTLGGADVTSSLEQYGVKLGGDFTATERRAAITGGAGVLVPIRMLYVDVGYRLTSIRTSDAINVHRFNIGVGARF
jgi:opacity protein-like surface antigen